MVSLLFPEFHVTPRDVTQFLEEATIMKDFKHDHVLHLLGVAIDDDRVYVVLPYMENGDLKSFISNDVNVSATFGTQNCLCHCARADFLKSLVASLWISLCMAKTQDLRKCHGRSSFSILWFLFHLSATDSGRANRLWYASVRRNVLPV